VEAQPAAARVSFHSFPVRLEQHRGRVLLLDSAGHVEKEATRLQKLAGKDSGQANDLFCRFWVPQSLGQEP
jgi:hypothetical protein